MSSSDFGPVWTLTAVAVAFVMLFGHKLGCDGLGWFCTAPPAGVRPGRYGSGGAR